jgi:hypothetical protein
MNECFLPISVFTFILSLNVDEKALLRNKVQRDAKVLHKYTIMV